MNKFTFPVLAVVTLVAALPAFADRGLMVMEEFDTIDADKDGKVTKAEIEAHRAARFAAADTDKNGTLSAEELSAMHQAHMAEKMAERSAKMMEHLDDDADGQISAEEFAAMGKRKSPFDRADADSDGAITKAEMEAAMEKMGGKGRGHGKGHGHGKGWFGMGDN